MLTGAGVIFLLLAGSCTQSWMGISDFHWMMIFAAAALICFAADFILKRQRRKFKEAVEKEVNRRIYYYRK